MVPAMRAAPLSRRLLPLLLAAVFATFVVELAPHLVHHTFEHEGEKASADCAFASAAERQPGASTVVATLSSGAPPALLGPALGPVPIVARFLAPVAARAPPLAAS